MRGRVRPSRPVAAVGVVIGVAFLFVAPVFLDGAPGGFAALFVLIILAGIGLNAYWAFAKEPAGYLEVDVDPQRSERQEHGPEQRLRSLERLRRDGLITEEEYQRKRSEIIDSSW